MTFTKYFAKNVSEGIIISDNTSDITFAVGHNLPTDTSAGVYLISIEDEIVEVETLAEDVTGNLIASVLRAREDTTFYVHAADVTGKLLFTAGAMNQVSDAIVDMENTIIAITMSDEDVETAYNNRVSVVDQVVAEAGTDTTVYRWTPERLTQAINAKIPVTTVNTYTGDVVLNSDDISDTTSLQKFATEAQLTKIDFISVTQAVDLDTIESDTTTNNAKVSNVTHTGEVTGSSGLTIDPTSISGKTGVTAVAGDYVLLWDATDSALKKANVSDFMSTGAITSVNDQTSVVTLVTGHISDTTSTQKYATAAEKTKIGYISVTQAVDLDALESDTATNNAKISFNSTASTKLGNISVTQAVDLDTMESNIATNNAKVSNATHTGDVTGSTGLTIDPTAISGKTEVTPATGDYVLLWDATDSLLKKGLVNNFINASGLVTTDSTSSLTNKTVQSRIVNATVDSTSINYNADNGDIFNATLIGNTILKNPTGTLYDGQKIMVRVRTGTGSFALTYDTLYRFSTDVPQPTLPTAATKLVYLLFIYNSTDLRLDLLSANQGF